MLRVLVAEDEPRARESLTRILTRDGREVRSAATGRQAIDVGSSFRPDVLVADWMLNNHINGLHVSKALRVINGSLQTILVSGFPSKMYSEQLLATGAFDFLEKPLDVERLLESVERAACAAPGEKIQGTEIVPGIVRVTPGGDILHRNSRATVLFESVAPGKQIANLSEILPGAELASLSCDRARRVKVSCWSGETTHWRVCLKCLNDSPDKLVVLLPDGDVQKIDLETLRMLLGFPEPWGVVWPLKGMAVVVDPDLASRRLVLAQMRRARAKHRDASSASEALQVLNEHPRIDLIMVDYALGPDSIRELLTVVNAGHGGATVIGISTSDAEDEHLRALGCAHTLRKPWGVCDLLDIVTCRL